MTIEPFRIDIGQDVLDDLSQRLAAYRPPPSPEDRGWEDGTSLPYLAELVDHWRHRFDWRAQEAALNRLPQFTATVDGQRLHFVHARGTGPKPLPLVLCHGWPDGFQRFAKIIPLLADPGAYGADPADAFDVVVPSLPGYGFSPRGPATPGRGAWGQLLHRLMTDTLGYARFGAHGGDIGAAVCDQLCGHPGGAVAGVHFTNVPMARRPPAGAALSAAEQAFVAAMERFQQEGGGYMHLQGTRPWTPAVGLNDSPAGLAAWIVEKMRAWSDCGGDMETRFTKDELLTNVMVYWVTQSIGTSFLAYRDATKPAAGPGPGSTAGAATGTGRGAPTGFAIFPRDIANAPREWAERFYDVRRWTEMPAGGHFAALEEPTRLAVEIRAFFRDLR